MSVKRFATSLVLAAALSVNAFGENVKSFVNFDNQILSSLKEQSKENAKYDEIFSLLNMLEESSTEFNLKVTKHLFENIYEWSKGDTQHVGSTLANLASHLHNKSEFYAQLKKVLKKSGAPKDLREKLVEIDNMNHEMNRIIQNMIDVTYMGIDAKHLFSALSVSAQMRDMNLDDYWFNPFTENKEKTIYLISKKASENKDFDSVMTLEDELNDELQKYNEMKKASMAMKLPSFGGFSFEAMKKSHFSTVSFM